MFVIPFAIIAWRYEYFMYDAISRRLINMKGDLSKSC